MSGFFKFLWRLNAVLAFAALVAAIVFLTLFSKERIDRPLINYVIPPPAPAAAKLRPTYTYMLEPDLVIGGKTETENFELYRLVRWGKIKGKPVAPEASAVVNILISDKKKNANTWMFKGNTRVILGQEAILGGVWYYRESEIDEDVPVHLIVLKVVDADSNHDGLYNVDDRQTLYVAKSEGGEPQAFLTADQIWFDYQKGKTFVVSYRDGGKAFFATYSLPDFKLVSQNEIPDMPK